MLPLVRRVHLDADVARALAEACRAHAPREFVGVLAGVRTPLLRQVTTFAPLPNQSLADDRFTVDPLAFAAAEASVRANGSSWLGFVHSHPGGSPELSAIDREELWRDCLQLIVSGNGDAPRFAAHHSRGDVWQRLSLTIGPAVAVATAP